MEKTNFMDSPPITVRRINDLGSPDSRLHLSFSPENSLGGSVQINLNESTESGIESSEVNHSRISKEKIAPQLNDPLFQELNKSNELRLSDLSLLSLLSPKQEQRQSRHKRTDSGFLETGGNSSLVVMSHTLLPTHTNAQGTAFGGRILEWMDICAGIAAKRHCRSNAVTASMDDLHFRSTAKVGDVITIQARVNRTFNRSLEVGVLVEAEYPLSGQKSCYFIFVALDSQGHSQTIRPFVPISEEDKQCWEEAEMRRELRKTLQEQSKRLEESAKAHPVEVKDPSNAKSSKESKTQVTHLVLGSHANTIGVTFGGHIMAWMEGCAIISAMRHARKLCHCVGVDSMSFLHPIQVGEAVLIQAKVSRAFRTSMEIAVVVKSENLMTGETKKCNSAYFTYLAVEDNKPSQIPQLVPETEGALRRYHAALSRRHWRMERKALFDVVEKRNDEVAEEKIISSLIHSASTSEGWDCMHEDSSTRVWFKDFVGSTLMFKDTEEMSEDRVCCMKGELVVPRPPSEVIELIWNLTTRLKWDAMYSSGSVFKELGPGKRILHLVGQQPEAVQRSVDFSLLQYVPVLTTQQKEAHISYIISEHSIHAVPKHSEFVRGQTLPPSGFVIYQDGSSSTRVCYLVRQLGNEGLGASMESQWEIFIKSLFELKKMVLLLNEKSYTLL